MKLILVACILVFSLGVLVSSGAALDKADMVALWLLEEGGGNEITDSINGLTGEFFGNPEWTADPRFSTFPGRKENEAELNQRIEEWTMDHSAEAVMTMMQEAGVAAGIVSNAEDLLDKDPQLSHRGFFQSVEHPEVGVYRSPRAAYVFSENAYETTHAPLLGEHTEYVLKEILSLSDDEVEALVIAGAVE